MSTIMFRTVAVVFFLSICSMANAENLIYKWSKVTFAKSEAFTHIGVGQPERTRIGLINREINLTIKATPDLTDRWASPAETLETKTGDCEDFAILKLQALMNIGIEKERLALLVVRDKQSGELHAVAKVKLDDGQQVVLDNRNHQLVPLTLYPNTILAQFNIPKHGRVKWVTQQNLLGLSILGVS